VRRERSSDQACTSIFLSPPPTKSAKLIPFFGRPVPAWPLKRERMYA